MVIPRRYVRVCAAVARLCQQAGLPEATLTIMPSRSDPWQFPITMSWTSGRHGDSAQRFTLSSHLQLTETIEEHEPPPPVRLIHDWD